MQTPRVHPDNMSSPYMHKALVIILVLGAVATRLLPHPPNFTATGAVALFAGAYLGSLPAVLTCLGALLVSDALLGFYHPLSMTAVYAGSLAGIPVGRWLLRSRPLPWRLALAATTGAIVFCAVSNLGVWWLYYPRTPAGLLACYLAALPFCARTLLGNFCWLPALFLLRALLGKLAGRLLDVPDAPAYER